MINKLLRDFVNLLIYGGWFIGLCAASITALSLHSIGKLDAFYNYTLFIGVCTGALYCGHRVIGLKKMAHIRTSERFDVIRKYAHHIWFYFGCWIVLAIFLFFKLESFSLLIWMLPGGFIAVGYVLPLLVGRKRLRDLGWGKIIMIGWSWAWLTAFVPLCVLAHEPVQMAMVLTAERMLFIIAITVPFEVRDILVDRSVGLTTLPEKFGKRGTSLFVACLCIGMVALSFIASEHYSDRAYFFTTLIMGAITWRVYQYSDKTQDDYFFGGLIDGLMIFALLVYVFLTKIL